MREEMGEVEGEWEGKEKHLRKIIRTSRREDKSILKEKRLGEQDHGHSCLRHGLCKKELCKTDTVYGLCLWHYPALS